MRIHDADGLLELPQARRSSPSSPATSVSPDELLGQTPLSPLGHPEARLGGDEFAALAYNVDTVLERLRFAVAGAPAIGPYPLAVSLGVALLATGANRSLDDLLADADQRMYENKRARKAAV